MGIIQGHNPETAYQPMHLPFRPPGRPTNASLCITQTPLRIIFRHESSRSNIHAAVRHTCSHLLQLKLLRELLIEVLQLSDELVAGLHDELLWRGLAVGVYAEHEGRKERVRDLVGDEADVLHAEELVAEKVGEGVVLLVEGELSGIRDLWWIVSLAL